MAEDLNSDGSSDCPSKKNCPKKPGSSIQYINSQPPAPFFVDPPGRQSRHQSSSTAGSAGAGAAAPAPDAELLEAENRRSRSCWTWEVGSCGGFFQKNVGFHIGNFHKSWRDLPKIVGFKPKKWGDVTYWSIPQLFWFKTLVGKGKNGVESWKFSEVFFEVSGKVPSGNQTWRAGEVLCNSSIFFPLKNHSYSATFGSLIGSNITKPFFPIGSFRAMFDLSNWIQIGRFLK